MRQVFAALSFIMLLLLPTVASAQSAQDPSASVPRLITITGVYRPADGKAPDAVETVTFSIYADAQGGAPLWQETQQVTLDDRGRYAVVLGAAHADGIPPSVFASGQWLGTVFERPGEVEGPRVRLTSVPYAMRAAEADTLGGHPASDYLLATGATGDTKSATAATRSDLAAPAGTANFLPKFVDAVNLGDSALYDAGGMVGLGTTTPFDMFHVRFTNTGGTLTGLAVQNLGNTATSYSGMLFYDQNNQLGQFQGFNNVTHEYRINNVAKNGASQFDGSINFMVGSTSRFLVANNGNIGIGTTAPAVNFEVSNALSTTAHTLVLMTSYGNNSFGSATIGRKARGTAATPAAVQNGDELATFGALGYGATAFSPLSFAQGLSIRAAQNWTDTAQATSMSFSTTSPGVVQPVVRMTLDASGNLGIGTTNPDGALEVVRSGGINPDSNVVSSSYGGEPRFLTQAARGLILAPTALQLGDTLGVFASGGYGATGFGDPSGGFAVFAAENFTDAAHGTGAAIYTTPLGAIDPSPVLTALPSGNVGIGTPGDVNGIPTAADKLQVFGNVRVGDSGTNGCIKNFAGTGLVGTCSSDRRLKKNITPFAPMLDKVTALQPVHYFWRSDEFPDRHFGSTQNYGLIAQDVEQVLPELVATDSDGYKAVDYSKLPLLTIQAMKELKAENDALKQQVVQLKEQVENDPLKERVAELERLIAEMLPKQK